MIQLTKDNTATPDAYSNGDGTDPVVVALTLDGSNSPTTVQGSPATSLFVWANDDTGNISGYTGITVDLLGTDTGITWELSTDDITFTPSITIADLDVTVANQATQIYARATAVNDGTVATASYVTADVRITSTETPA